MDNTEFCGRPLSVVQESMTYCVCAACTKRQQASRQQTPTAKSKYGPRLLLRKRFTGMAQRSIYCIPFIVHSCPNQDERRIRDPSILFCDGSAQNRTNLYISLAALHS